MQHRQTSLRGYGAGEDGHGRAMSQRLYCATYTDWLCWATSLLLTGHASCPDADQARLVSVCPFMLLGRHDVALAGGRDVRHAELEAARRRCF
jgi:hypothetical protein